MNWSAGQDQLRLLTHDLAGLAGTVLAYVDPVPQLVLSMANNLCDPSQSSSFSRGRGAKPCAERLTTWKSTRCRSAINPRPGCRDHAHNARLLNRGNLAAGQYCTNRLGFGHTPSHVMQRHFQIHPAADTLKRPRQLLRDGCQESRPRKQTQELYYYLASTASVRVCSTHAHFLKPLWYLFTRFRRV